MQEYYPSVDHMAAILEHAPIAIYVSAADNQELLYANQLARELFFPEADGQRIDCFQKENLKELISVCRAGKRDQFEPQVCELRYQGEVRSYQISSNFIEWNGKRAQIEYIQDITEIRREKEQSKALINAIPGGVAIYKLSDSIETVYFSDGVPELSGYTVEEYCEITKHNAMELTFPEDQGVVNSNLKNAIIHGLAADFEFRKLHKDGHIVWVRIQAKKIGEENGYPLIHCVYHNISGFKETQMEMEHLMNSIPGGIVSYRVEEGHFNPVFFSDGVLKLSGHTRKDYMQLAEQDSTALIFQQDRERVVTAAKAALISGEVLNISFRVWHKNGHLTWIRFNGRRIGQLSGVTNFYAVLTAVSEETQLYQSIANEVADGIYVIDKENYDLLYANEAQKLFIKDADWIGQKCYTALHGKSEPCKFCSLRNHAADGEAHDMVIEGSDRFYSTHFQEADWNGIPAYIKYVRDITDDVAAREEKERLEQYFQTVVKNLPGGIGVIRYKKDGSMVPEFLSDGFAAMTGMSLEEAWQIYKEDAMAGVHPDDVGDVSSKMAAYIASGENQCKLTYRLKKGSDDYVWIQNTISLIQSESWEGRVYAVFHDISREREEQEQIRQQYKDLIMQHYSTSNPNEVIRGHCNISRNWILEIEDQTGSDLLKTFGYVREDFFTGLASLVVDEKERQIFLDTYLNAPALEAFSKNETEKIVRCFVKLPKETKGRYVQFKVNMVEEPDTGDITGILTVTDITDQTVTDRILHKLSVTNYDFVIDLDLDRDTYTILASNKNLIHMPRQAKHSEWTQHMLKNSIVPKDQENYVKALESNEIRRRLKEEGRYTFAYSMLDEKGDIRTKNMTISDIDIRIGRACMVRTDITDSMREQQGMLNMLAYTFELLGFVNIRSKRFTIYTRETVLKNLQPRVEENYEDIIARLVEHSDENQEEMRGQLYLDAMLCKLKNKPSGYDFVYSFKSRDGIRYKQVNVLWGDENHRTVCMVRADVTDMLTAERQTKQKLENALALAKEASQAKSDFLSAMSHDIRTPMNGIMGMTALAEAHIDDRERVEDCLHKISISSKHLLSLINDILDMSKIENSKITLNRGKIFLPELIEQLSAIMTPQAKTGSLLFDIRMEHIRHKHFYGDSLRINQILINILSNAIKFTPEGGRVDFIVEETEPVHNKDGICYRFTISDTGIGIAEQFLDHIFDAFTRSSSVSRIEGTGLGLSITKGLVDLMGGRISVQSQVGKGSTFRVELECESADDNETAGVEEQRTEKKDVRKEKVFYGRRFLVAEDNEINAEILCELLSMYGAESVVKPDGVQTVQAFSAEAAGTYDAVLMDIQMPEMNGYEAARAIRSMSREDAKVIPIIAMTANAFAEDVQAALDAGMTAHIAKPIDLDVMQTALSKALSDAATKK